MFSAGTLGTFIAVLGVTVVIYYLVPKSKQWLVLLVASEVFLFVLCGLLTVFTLISAVVTYMFAKLIESTIRSGALKGPYADVADMHICSGDKSGRVAKTNHGRSCGSRWVLSAGLIFNFSLLILFKYSVAGGYITGWISELSEAVFVGTRAWIAPIGISFYTLQTTGYLIDVYRGKESAERSFWRTVLFVTYFPQMLQGPISRHSDLAPRLSEYHEFDAKGISSGLLRLLWGVFKKIVIADTVGVAVQSIVSAPNHFEGADVLFLIIAYSIQIYGDFTGGIDIALGASEMLGIRLCENFDSPFASISLAQYWNRWHITLGSWFTDYVFYPLSLSKAVQRIAKICRSQFGVGVGKRIPLYLSTLFTWTLTGLWHGASLNFVIWGVGNGIMMLISKEIETVRRRRKKVREKGAALRGDTTVRCILFGREDVQKKPCAAKGKLIFRRTKECFYVVISTFFHRGAVFMVVGTIRLLDIYGDVGLTVRMLSTIFTRPESYLRIFSSIDKMGLVPSQLILIIFGVLIMTVIGSYDLRYREEMTNAVDKHNTDGCRLSHLIAARPIGSAAVCAVLILVCFVFGNYGIEFHGSDFIYSQF